MIMPSGEYAGKDLEMLVLNEPGYIKRVIEHQPSCWVPPDVEIEINRLITKFDSKPFLVGCCGCKQHNVTRVSYAIDNPEPYPWCDTCNESAWIGDPSSLRIARNYRDVLNHVERDLAGGDSLYREFIRRLAAYKGLPDHLGKAKAKKFFG